MIKLVIFSIFHCLCPAYLCCSLNGERWNYPLRSELLWLCVESQSETGRDKQRPGGAASCQTALRMIEDNSVMERKHPRRPSPCTLLLHRRPWWTTGNQQLVQDGAQNSFTTFWRQKCWKSHSHGAFKEEWSLNRDSGVKYCNIRALEHVCILTIPNVSNKSVIYSTRVGV